MAIAIYAPTLVINNVPVAYEPDSLMLKLGKGERNQSPQVAGTDSVVLVYAENSATKKAKVSFEFRTTKENIDNVTDWQKRKNGNVIQIVDKEASYVVEQAALINDPELKTGSDGKVSLEFEGMPVVIG